MQKQTLTNLDLDQLEQRYRARLVNSLSGAKSANLIGTSDSGRNTNLAIVSSCFHIGANPALLGMIIRPSSVPRHSFENILHTEHWTVNHVNSFIVDKAHQTSARYPRELSEFDAVGLTPEFLDNFPAPFVKESKIRLGLKLAEHLSLQINGTKLLIGEIQHIDFPMEAICSDGHIDLNAAGSLAVSGLDEYHELKSLARYSYAKPNQTLRKVNKR